MVQVFVKEWPSELFLVPLCPNHVTCTDLVPAQDWGKKINWKFEFLMPLFPQKPHVGHYLQN